MPVMAKKLTKADQLSHQSSAELKADLVTLTASLGLQRAFLDRKLSEGHGWHGLGTESEAEKARAEESGIRTIFRLQVLTDQPIRTDSQV